MTDDELVAIERRWAEGQESAAKMDVDALVAEVRRQRGEIDRLRLELGPETGSIAT